MPEPHDEDEVLVQRFLAGDPTAFEALFQRHSDWVFRRCVAMVGCREDAEDLTQEIFLAVYQKLRTFRGQSSFRLWLAQICNHRCIDFLRRRARERRRRDDYERMVAQSQTAGANPEAPASNPSVVERVQRALAALPEKDRLVLVLHYVEERSYTEIAQELGWSVGRVKARVHRAKEKFRRVYEPLSSQPEESS
jgi:RNA polymerase sigma-70 factor (ECF subfamily)